MLSPIWGSLPIRLHDGPAGCAHRPVMLKCAMPRMALRSRLCRELASRYGLTSWVRPSVTVAVVCLRAGRRGGAGLQIVWQLRVHFEQHGEARYADISRSVNRRPRPQDPDALWLP